MSINTSTQPGRLITLATRTPFSQFRAMVPNAACLLVLVYSIFYVVLEPVAGITWALALGAPMWLTATAWAAMVGVECVVVGVIGM